MEDLNYYYANYSRYGWFHSIFSHNLISPRIYNDVITLRRGSSYMWVENSIIRCPLSLLTCVLDRTKLSLSHALSQSVKISLVSISVYQSTLLPPRLRIDGFEFTCRLRTLWCPLWTYFLFFSVRGSDFLYHRRHKGYPRDHQWDRQNWHAP